MLLYNALINKKKNKKLCHGDTGRLLKLIACTWSQLDRVVVTKNTEWNRTQQFPHSQPFSASFLLEMEGPISNFCKHKQSTHVNILNKSLIFSQCPSQQEDYISLF